MEIVSQDEVAHMTFPDEEPAIIDVEPEELTTDRIDENTYTAFDRNSSVESYSASDAYTNSNITSATNSAPVWLDDKSVNEIVFCEEFLTEHRIICINNQFIGFDGVIDDTSIEKLIYEKLKPHIQKGVATKVKQLCQALKLDAHSEEIVPDMNEIHLLNGTFNAETSGFSYEKKFCFGRLNNRYNEDAPSPEKFLSFLSELLIPEDILTLQEWFGYLLIPCTKAQKMLTMIGNGGEGKSRLGVLLKNIYGRTMSTGNLYTLETNRFARAALENAYLFLDDDMIMDKLSETNVLKTIITNEGKMLIEKKGIQPYSANIYAKLMSFGNGSLKSLTDKSDGFFRRQIIITTKPKPENRIDDPFLVEKFISEKEGILLWSLEGLKRLMSNKFRFTISERTAENLRNSMKDSSNIIGFLEDEQFVKFGKELECSTADLYSGYCHWCAINSTDPMKKEMFNLWLKQNHEKYKIEYCANVQSHENSKRARGYRGLDTTYRNNLR